MRIGEGDFRSKSGQNRVRIRSGRKGSAGSVPEGRSGWEGPCSSSESLYPELFAYTYEHAGPLETPQNPETFKGTL